LKSLVLIISSILFAGLIAFPLPAADDTQMNSVLASVNGEAITLVDVLPLTRNKEMQARSVYSGERLEQVVAGYRREVVDELIDNLLIQAEFVRHDFVLSNQDVEREIDQFAIRIGCRSRDQLIRHLGKNGSTLEEVRMGIRKNMMVQMMLYRQIRIADPVSPREVYEYFKANEASFATPEKVGLAMLKLDSSRSDLETVSAEITAELKKNPEGFSALVSKYTPELGNGDLGEIDSKLLRPEFSAAFKEFAPGMIAGPIKVYDGMVWLKVISFVPAQKVVFSDVEEQIKLDMELKMREKVIKDYVKKLRSGAVIDYFI
jgi:parvulin-like peptidyl-prolyl isomerase